MFGIQFIKVQPTTYLLQFKNGKIVREGPGLSVFYYAPTSTMAAVPIGSTDVPFIFRELTADFQEVSVQGQVIYRITDAKKVAVLLNFSFDHRRGYLSDDPLKLQQRVINAVNVLTRNELESLTLRQAMRASDELVQTIAARLSTAPEIASLGLEILGLAILAIKPSPETSRALEAEAREQLLKEADDAVYRRRNAAVEQERAIRENELNTDIAVENKKRQIRETQMTADILIEERKKELVSLAVENTKAEADARAHAMSAMMQSLNGADPRVLQALAGAGMDPEQLIANAFQEIAVRAEKIGELNISPELLRGLLSKKSRRE